MTNAKFTIAVIAALAAAAPLFSGPTAETGAKNETKAVTVPQKTPFEIASEKIKSPDPITRKSGIMELLRLKDKKSAGLIIPLLKDESPLVRMAAVDALGMLREKKAVREIEKMLLKDKVEGVRRAAATTLSYMGARSAGKSLVRALDDKSPSVRYAAIRTLSVLMYRPAEKKLISLLKTKDLNLLRAAINSLGKLRSGKAAGKIAKYRRHPDEYVRIEVARALGEIGNEKYIEDLKELLDNDKESRKVRAEAAYSLAKMKDAGGLEYAQEILREETKDISLVQIALNTVGLVGTAESVKLLGKLIDKTENPSVKSYMKFTRERIKSRLKLSSRAKNGKKEKETREKRP